MLDDILCILLASVNLISHIACCMAVGYLSNDSDANLREVTKVQRGLKLEKPELLAIVAGGALSFLDVFIGLVAMPFAGAGPMGFLRVLSITLGLELPVYIIFIFVSRRALMYACWSMYALIHIEDCVFVLSEKWFPVDPFGILKAFVGTTVFSLEGLVSLGVALLATYLFRKERESALGHDSQTWD
jgi:hypothetical protein